MNTAPFLIVFTQSVVFKDRTGATLKTYEVGDVVVATAQTSNYFVTPMGGIYDTEARRVDGEELIAYCNNGDQRYRYLQHAKDKIPVWATNLRLNGAV